YVGQVVTCAHFENSEVFKEFNVAVAVMDDPTATETGLTKLKLATPLAFVVVVRRPRKVCPWPKPELSHALLAKNSIVAVWLDRRCNEPLMSVVAPLLSAAVSTG